MSERSAAASEARHRLTRAELGTLLRLLRGDGYRLIGPTVRGGPDGGIGAIVQSEIEGIEDLPRGWTADAHAGTYRLRRRDDDALFGYAVGPQSFKQHFFVPRLRLVQLRRSADGFDADGSREPPPKLALIGARSCDLHAIAVQDRTFLDGPFVDPDYAARREGVFVVAVNCGVAGGTCFCVSMETGPRATIGFDLALTEIVDEPHRFVVDVGTEAGRDLLRRVWASGTEPTDTEPRDDVTAGADSAAARLASAEDQERADAIVFETARSMGRALDTNDIHGLLLRNLEHPRWDDVAERCLACTNCTLACPTCFCASVEDTGDLDGAVAERWRRWDSCFTLDHSYLHGGSVRASVRSRYRQWLTHKLATWIDQFGTSGCVGCGRCVTWCPAGIDITEEVAAIRATDGASERGAST